jgi:ABC-type lipoprotein export system ATPase subunit
VATPVVSIRGVTRVYGENGMYVPVLRGVDLDIEAGEIVALLGPSGSGKSTLLNILGCLDRPTQGTYHLGGRDVSTLSPTEQAWVRLRYLGFIFQSFHLIGHATALENVAMPLYYAGVPRKERFAMAEAALRRLDLGERMDHRPNQLSGGQRQRVAIARSIVNKPRIILADEPTGALDSKTGVEVLQLLRELHDETGVTLIVVTHDEKVAAWSDRRIRMQDGKVVSDEEVQHAAAAH